MADDYAIPASKSERDQIYHLVQQYTLGGRIVPPLSLSELQQHADTIATIHRLPRSYRHWLTVLINNQLWREPLGAIPYFRRLLLLPQCLRPRESCPAKMDAIGLLCQQCGRCPIGALQHQAEQLGYVVLVAEGTTVVTTLMQKGVIDAVVGVSCLAVLERTFPHFVDQAIPGIAIPLNLNGCNYTQTDLDRLHADIAVRSSLPWLSRTDIDRLQAQVESWFRLDRLQAELGEITTATEKLAYAWLAQSGKRWRPLLAVCVFKALTYNEDDDAMIRKLAVAVECFHKASLAHDDIEDDSPCRYQEPSLHCRYGVAIALNVGDFLVGEGYRLIGQCGATSEQIRQMLAVAAQGHRELCLGQGEELSWMADPTGLSVSEVLEIFRRKTAPAFEVSLVLGAIAANADASICQVLVEFSRYLGIAYQIRDDLRDFSDEDEDDDSDLQGRRPSVLLALTYQSDRPTVERFLAKDGNRDDLRRQVRQAAVEAGVEEQARQLLADYRNRAIAALRPLTGVMLKSLLHRIAARIFP